MYPLTTTQQTEPLEASTFPQELSQLETSPHTSSPSHRASHDLTHQLWHEKIKLQEEQLNRLTGLKIHELKKIYGESVTHVEDYVQGIEDAWFSILNDDQETLFQCVLNELDWRIRHQLQQSLLLVRQALYERIIAARKKQQSMNTSTGSRTPSRLNRQGSPRARAGIRRVINSAFGKRLQITEPNVNRVTSPLSSQSPPTTTTKHVPAVIQLTPQPRAVSTSKVHSSSRAQNPASSPPTATTSITAPFPSSPLHSLSVPPTFEPMIFTNSHSNSPQTMRVQIGSVMSHSIQLPSFGSSVTAPISPEPENTSFKTFSSVTPQYHFQITE